MDEAVAPSANNNEIEKAKVDKGEENSNKNDNNNTKNNNRNKNSRNRNRNSGHNKHSKSNDNLNKNNNSNDNKSNNNNSVKNKENNDKKNDNDNNNKENNTNENNNNNNNNNNDNENNDNKVKRNRSRRRRDRRQKQKAKADSKSDNEEENKDKEKNNNGNGKNKNRNRNNSKNNKNNNKNHSVEKPTEDPEGSSSSSEDEDDEEAADLLGQIPSSTLNLPLQPILVMCPFKDCKQENSPFMNPVDLQEHLGLKHHINIHNIEHVVPFIEKYLNYWIDKIEKSNNKVENFGYKLKNTNIYSIPSRTYQKEDISIRQDLQREKLNEMLMIQDRERKDTNKPRKCLFCKKVVNERINYFQHMFTEHNFNIGLPDNIVNIDEFLYILHTKLNSLQCLYCEKIFKSNAVLRKHMRKKKHFKINSKNHIYDKFYIINYLEPGKNWENFVNDKYESDDDKEE